MKTVVVAGVVTRVGVVVADDGGGGGAVTTRVTGRSPRP